MSGRRHEIRRRRPNALSVKRRILAVCLGRRTERDYLDALKRAFPAHATVVIRARNTDPGNCVDYAIRLRADKSNADFDEVWCVFDVDEFDIEKCVRRATDAGIELAVSNPCFELWLLLHLVEASRPFTDYRDVRRELVKVVPGYEKPKVEFERFRPGICQAIDRARRLEEAADGKHGVPNPSSGMWRLAAQIVGRQTR